MKWKKDDPPQPQDGQVRTHTKFAWRPTPVGEWVVWLETFHIAESFFQPASGSAGWWRETERAVLYYD